MTKLTNTKKVAWEFIWDKATLDDVRNAVKQDGMDIQDSKSRLTVLVELQEWLEQKTNEDFANEHSANIAARL